MQSPHDLIFDMLLNCVDLGEDLGGRTCKAREVFSASAFDPDRWNLDADGIFFYMDKEKAERRA